MTDPPTADTGSFFDDEAKRYDAAHDGEGFVGYALRKRMAVALRLLGPSSGDVLDCGMGPGRLLVELERRGWSVSGVDVSSEMVALARARLPRSADRLLEASFESLPFPSESFDGVVATGVLEYVEDVPRALTEVARVLRPGGLFVVSMPNPRAVRTFWRHRVLYAVARVVKPRLRFGRPVPLARPGRLSERRLQDLLDAAGLEVAEVEYIVLFALRLEARFPSVTARLARRLERVSRRLRPLLGGQFVVAARKADGISSEPIQTSCLDQP